MTTAAEHEMVPSGMTALDETTGGIPIGEFCLVCGGADSGKTILSLQFAMAGLKREERVAWVLPVDPEELLAQAEEVGLPVGDYLRTNQFILLNQKTQARGIIGNESDLHGLISALENEIVGWEPTRIIFDSAIPLIDLFHEDFRKAGLAAFVRALRKWNLTAVWTTRMPTSGEAMLLRKHIEELAGCSLHLDEHVRPDGSSTRRLVVRKLHGLNPPYPVYQTEVVPEEGLVLRLQDEVGLESPKEKGRVGREEKPQSAELRKSLLFTQHGAKPETLTRAPGKESAPMERPAGPETPRADSNPPKRAGSKGFSFASASPKPEEKDS